MTNINLLSDWCKNNPANTDYPVDVFQKVTDSLKNGIVLDTKNIISFSPKQKVVITKLLYDTGSKTIATNIIEHLIQLHNIVELQRITPDKKFTYDIEVKKNDIIEILNTPEVENAFHNATSIDTPQTTYECIEFIKWEYPFITLWSGWFTKVPDDIALTRTPSGLLSINVEDVVFSNKEYSQNYRTQLKEYGIMYQETIKKLDDVIRIIINSGIDGLPSITNWRNFLIDSYIYIYSQKQIIEKSKQFSHLMLNQEKLGYDFISMIQNVHFRDDDKMHTLMIEELEDIKEKAKGKKDEMINLLLSIDRCYSQSVTHRKNSERLYGQNQYYEIDAYEVWWISREDILPLSTWGKWDELRFLDHSYFEKYQEKMMNTTHAIRQLHDKEKMILAMAMK